MRRMALALGVRDLDEIGARITQLMDLKVPDGIVAKLSLIPRLLEVARFPPRVKGGYAAVSGGRLAGQPGRSRASFRS